MRPTGGWTVAIRPFLEPRRFRRPTPVEMTAITLAVGWFTWFLFYLGDAPPSGDRVPKQPPDESRRLRHPSGFSFVAPPHWNLDAFDDDSIRLSPAYVDVALRRRSAILEISRLGAERPAATEALSRVGFLGDEAYEKMEVCRKGSFDDPAWSHYDLYVHHGETWYYVGYGVAEERPVLPVEMRSYLETLRWE